MKNKILDTKRPYLIIPKLIIQPTWGGTYIAQNKGWIDRPGHDVKIGQSYELFSGSNLSLLQSSEDGSFLGELTDNAAVQIQTNPENSIKLSDLVAVNPENVLGEKIVNSRGSTLALLIKFTQALGNSFQVHIKDGVQHPEFRPKPESWYYFEPGLITFGIKPDADWSAYEICVREVEKAMSNLSLLVKSGELRSEDIQPKVNDILARFDPWQYVNTVSIEKDQIVDLSEGGIHHSWEEDPEKAPLGNILLELQGEAMDDISTFRSFDKGKITDDGSIRDLHIDTYFEVIDRNPATNDPSGHIRRYSKLIENNDHRLDKLIRSRHYNLDKLTLKNQGSSYSEHIDQYKHLFVKSGRIQIIAGNGEITLSTGHSCFIPAETGQFTINNLTEKSEILISF